MNSQTFLYVVYLLSIGIHVIALIISLVFVLPLQIKESKVKDGIATLRKQLLLMGINIIFLSVVTIIVLSYRLFVTLPQELMRYLVTSLVLLHSLGFLMFSINAYKIYNHQHEEGKSKTTSA